MLGRHGIKSVAAEGFQAPGVVVSYTDDMGLHTGKAFLAEGLQTAAGVPLQCDEGPEFKSFRTGPFGLLQPAADLVKMLLKEDFTPAGANKVLFQLAPVMAVFAAVGPFLETLQNVWGRIYAEWFPSSGYSLVPGPELLWNESKDVDVPAFRSEIWIPVAKNR